eukprot:TRINITY_DN22042_c0_g1_i1.p1 TRINITY_DN22042_c0_g1~~TRINITY_DN22042_c0_g1_i1.p1  ORF type:complete len:503 (+),score=85.85 TRINITY_DN22042_c0_g1_i1:94-1602(+)
MSADMMTSSPAASLPGKKSFSGLPSIADKIDEIGLGLAQVRAAMLGGAVYLADGAELLLIGSVTRSVAKEWDLNAFERGSAVSIVFTGILIGNSCSGPFGDHLGRRLPVVLSYLGVAFWSALSACSQSYVQLSAIRLMVGLSFGIGQPAANTLISEVTPSDWRMVVSGSANCWLFAVGELYSAALIYYDDPSMKNLDWRWLLLMGAMPACILLVTSFFLLKQSPVWLSMKERNEEATEVLKSMASDNGKEDINFDFKPMKKANVSQTSIASCEPPEELFEPLMIIYAPDMIFMTLTVIFTCFTLNTVFFGSLYALPQVLTEVHLGMSPAAGLLMGCVWEMPGIALALTLGHFCPRRFCMMLYSGVMCVSMCLFAYGCSNQDVGMVYDVMMQIGYFGLKSVPPIGFTIAYQYAAEVYPAKARTTGNAAALAGGRVGGITSPLIFEWLSAATGSSFTFFYFGALCLAINFVLISMLKVEPFGKKLDDETEETPLLPEKLPIASA